MHRGNGAKRILPRRTHIEFSGSAFGALGVPQEVGVCFLDAYAPGLTNKCPATLLAERVRSHNPRWWGIDDLPNKRHRRPSACPKAGVGARGSIDDGKVQDQRRRPCDPSSVSHSRVFVARRVLLASSAAVRLELLSMHTMVMTMHV